MTRSGERRAFAIVDTDKAATVRRLIDALLSIPTATSGAGGIGKRRVGSVHWPSPLLKNTPPHVVTAAISCGL